MEEQDGNNRFLEEQLSIWDIQVIEKVSKKSKINNKIGKDDYSKKLQNKIIEKYKEISDLNRIIQYCGGGIGVEFISEGVYRTIYINKEGKEEFQLSKKSIVLPMDKILYYKNLEVPNEFQEKKLKTLKENFNVTKVIRRKGDENILIEVEDKIISIIPKGWILEFYGVQALYDEDEVKNFF